MRPSAFPFIDSGGCKPYIAQGAKSERRQEVQKGEAESHHQEDSFGTGLLPCFGSVCLIKDVSAWAELSCKHICYFTPSSLFQTFVVTWQEPSNRNKLTWQVHSLVSFFINVFYIALSYTIIYFSIFQSPNFPVCLWSIYPLLHFLEEQILLQTHSFSIFYIYQIFSWYLSSANNNERTQVHKDDKDHFCPGGKEKNKSQWLTKTKCASCCNESI